MIIPIDVEGYGLLVAAAWLAADALMVQSGKHSSQARNTDIVDGCRSDQSLSRENEGQKRRVSRWQQSAAWVQMRDGDAFQTAAKATRYKLAPTSRAGPKPEGDTFRKRNNGPGGYEAGGRRVTCWDTRVGYPDQFG